MANPTLDIPEEARSILEVLAQALTALQEKVGLLDAEMTRRARTDGLPSG